MLVFLIPVKHRATANNWQRVCQLLEQTLASVLNQTCDGFKIVVVCNEKPETNIESAKIDYLITDLAPPTDKEHDKAAKLILGLNHANQYNPDYVIVVDYDDFINCNLVEYALAQNNEFGYYINCGYVFEGKESLIYLERDFLHYCGTSLIVKPDLLPELLSGGSYAHFQIQLKHGRLSPIPFCGAIHNRQNGENLVATMPLKESQGIKDVRFLPHEISDEIKQTFNFRR